MGRKLFIEELETRQSSSPLFVAPIDTGTVTTMAIGEEGGDWATTAALGEEGGNFKPIVKQPIVTTFAVGEEGGDWVSTAAVGEEGGNIITSHAIGEEGGLLK